MLSHLSTMSYTAKCVYIYFGIQTYWKKVSSPGFVFLLRKTSDNREFVEFLWPRQLFGIGCLFEPAPLAAAIKTSNHMQCRVPISQGAPEGFFLDEFITIVWSLCSPVRSSARSLPGTRYRCRPGRADNWPLLDELGGFFVDRSNILGCDLISHDFDFMGSTGLKAWSWNIAWRNHGVKRFLVGWKAVPNSLCLDVTRSVSFPGGWWKDCPGWQDFGSSIGVWHCRCSRTLDSTLWHPSWILLQTELFLQTSGESLSL